MKFVIALALFALVAVAAAGVIGPSVVAPAFHPLSFGYAAVPGHPAAVVGPGVYREYHGAPLIGSHYAGLAL